jgi:hypothetical protein
LKIEAKIDNAGDGKKKNNINHGFGRKNAEFRIHDSE